MDDSGVISSMIPYVINYHGFKFYGTVPVSQGLIDSMTPIIYGIAARPPIYRSWHCPRHCRYLFIK